MSRLRQYSVLVISICICQIAACGGGSSAPQGPVASNPPGTPGPPPPAPGPPPSTSPQPPLVTGHPTFMSPHASPLAERGSDVFVVNTQADTLDIIDKNSRAVVRRINVGIDPVSVAVRPDGKEVWVANHVSDSISIVDNDATSATYHQVIDTVQHIDQTSRSTRFDEPVGIAFADNEKAYVALSSENLIAIVEVASRSVNQWLTISAQDPRAIKVRNGKLYVIPFESNNQTQISGCVGPIDGEQCTFDATQHVVTTNNVLSQSIVVDIVKHAQIPDRDLYVFDTGTDRLLEVVESVGTLLYGLAIDSTGQVFVAQTDARNDANGKAGTAGHGLAEMDNRAFLNQVTRVDCSSSCGQPERIDLEPSPPANPAPEDALATPFAIEISADDKTLVATAAGSNAVFTIDAISGDVLGRVQVDAVPRGIALESNGSGQPTRAWVLNAVANTVSVVNLADPANPQVSDSIALADPTHPEVKAGRTAFNDARASTTGTFSCESCHPDGGTDQLLWVLDTPRCNINGCTQIPPRITMPIRGLRDTAPYHWDGIPGDPYGGNNTANINGNDEPNCEVSAPESCTLNLVDGSLGSTMCAVGACPANNEGKAGALSATTRAAMAKFLLSVPYPPAPKRAYTNVLSQGAKDGFKLFHIDGDLQGDPEPNVCGDCHRMPFWVSTNTPGTGMEAPTWRGAYDRWLILPQGRLNIIGFDFYRNLTVRGTHEEEMWRLSWASRSRFNPVWNMVIEGSTGFSGSFARQVTLNSRTAGEASTAELLDALERSAGEGGVVLQLEGVFIENDTTTPVELQFDAPYEGGTYVEKSVQTDFYSRSELLTLAAAGEFVGTVTARLGENVDVDHPQPAIWASGNIARQAGTQVFPSVSVGDTSMALNGRHIEVGASVVVDGRKVEGGVECVTGTLPNCSNERLRLTLGALPSPAGMHFLQVQNPDGLFSNDFIFHTD